MLLFNVRASKWSWKSLFTYSSGSFFTQLTHFCVCEVVGLWMKDVAGEETLDHWSSQCGLSSPDQSYHQQLLPDHHGLKYKVTLNGRLLVSPLNSQSDWKQVTCDWFHLDVQHIHTTSGLFWPIRSEDTWEQIFFKWQ